MQDFRHIKAWQRAHALAIALHKRARNFSRLGYSRLRAQLTGAADSIGDTIMEGAGAATAIPAGNTAAGGIASGTGMLANPAAPTPPTGPFGQPKWAWVGLGAPERPDQPSEPQAVAVADGGSLGAADADAVAPADDGTPGQHRGR